MEEYKIRRDEVRCDEFDIDQYVNVLNGIVYFCKKRSGFYRGFRNTIAVDLTVAAYMLGLDAIEVLDKLVELDVIDPSDDDEDTWNRVRTVLDYDESFCWTWMIDPDVYFAHGKTSMMVSTLPIRFVAVDAE